MFRARKSDQSKNLKDGSNMGFVYLTPDRKFEERLERRKLVTELRKKREEIQEKF